MGGRRPRDSRQAAFNKDSSGIPTGDPVLIRRVAPQLVSDPADRIRFEVNRRASGDAGTTHMGAVAIISRAYRSPFTFYHSQLFHVRVI